LTSLSFKGLIPGLGVLYVIWLGNGPGIFYSSQGHTTDNVTDQGTGSDGVWESNYMGRFINKS